MLKRPKLTVSRQPTAEEWVKQEGIDLEIEKKPRYPHRISLDLSYVMYEQLKTKSFQDRFVI